MKTWLGLALALVPLAAHADQPNWITERNGAQSSSQSPSTPSGPTVVTNTVHSAPITGNTVVGATPVQLFNGGNYVVVEVQAQGAPICLSWGSAQLQPPVVNPMTNTGTCPVGMFFFPQGNYRSSGTGVPNTPLMAISSGNAMVWWETLQ